MQVRQVLETCLYAGDLESGECFYREVIGLQVLSRVAERHVFFRCGGGVFLLFNPQRSGIDEGTVPPHGSHGPGHVAFQIHPSEIESWRAHLREKGIAIEREVNWPGGSCSLYFRDPSGNSVELAPAEIWGLPEVD